MRSATTLRQRLQSTSTLSYLLAILLPVLCSSVEGHISYFAALPFALHFITLACVATIGGLWPSLLALIVAFCCRNAIPSHVFGPFSYPHYDIFRLAIISTGAFIISLGRSSRRRAQRKLQAALEDLQERTGALIDSLHNSKCACWTLDLDSGQSARWFRGSYPVFGRSFDETELLPSMADLLHLDDQPRLTDLAHHMRSSWEPAIFEYRCPWPNGELHTLEMRGTRVSQTPCVWRGVTMDITDRKLAEAALLRSEKLAAMGRLASTMAHEINNPLEAVTNLLFLARSDAAVPEPTRSYLFTAERELARLSNISRLTLGFVRTSGSSTRTPLSSTVEEVLSIFEHRLHNRGIALHREFDPSVSILIAPHELRQIATNLIANAADAVTQASVPAITVRVLTANNLAVLIIEDNGIGIPHANLQRIFEPFFSTKEEVGTGIGLWVTRELVERNNGQITAASDTSISLITFRVEFPMVSATP